MYFNLTFLELNRVAKTYFSQSHPHENYLNVMHKLYDIKYTSQNQVF